MPNVINELYSVRRAIAKTSAQRQRCWASCQPNPGVVVELSQKLDSLYETRRSLCAAVRCGERKEILRRARIEFELERLAA